MATRQLLFAFAFAFSVYRDFDCRDCGRILRSQFALLAAVAVAVVVAVVVADVVAFASKEEKNLFFAVGSPKKKQTMKL